MAQWLIFAEVVVTVCVIQHKCAVLAIECVAATIVPISARCQTSTTVARALVLAFILGERFRWSLIKRLVAIASALLFTNQLTIEYTVCHVLLS